MRSWIARLFGAGGAAAHEAAPVPDAPPGPAPATAPSAAAAADIDLDLPFWRWLGSAAPAGANAGLVLDELARLARSPQDAAGLVPRVPEVIPQLLRSMRDDSVSAADLARQLAQDPVLVAEVIREANSPFYRASIQVRTIDAALLVLGRTGLRMLLARAAFRPVIGMQGGPLARSRAPLVWRHTELTARAAGLLAPRLGADPFEAYLAGLMHDLGLMVAFRVADQLPGAALPADEAFAHALFARARELSARVALVWELPPPVAAAILQAGASGTAGRSALAVCPEQGERLARLRLLADHGMLDGLDPASSLDAASSAVFERLAQDSE